MIDEDCFRCPTDRGDALHWVRAEHGRRGQFSHVAISKLSRTVDASLRGTHVNKKPIYGDRPHEADRKGMRRG